MKKFKKEEEDWKEGKGAATKRATTRRHIESRNKPDRKNGKTTIQKKKTDHRTKKIEWMEKKEDTLKRAATLRLIKSRSTPHS